jgi:hypothetical protein
MNFMRALPCAVLISAIAFGATGAESDLAGKWTATSTASIAVTGDITVRENTLILGNGRRVKLTPVGEREGRWTPVMNLQPGMIYKLSPPSDPAALHGNTLCGERITYLVLTLLSQRGLSMSVHTGANPPSALGDHLCADYFYER